MKVFLRGSQSCGRIWKLIVLDILNDILSSPWSCDVMKRGLGPGPGRCRKGIQLNTSLTKEQLLWNGVRVVICSF